MLVPHNLSPSPSPSPRLHNPPHLLLSPTSRHPHPAKPKLLFSQLTAVKLPHRPVTDAACIPPRLTPSQHHRRAKKRCMEFATENSNPKKTSRPLVHKNTLLHTPAPIHPGVVLPCIAAFSLSTATPIVEPLWLFWALPPSTKGTCPCLFLSIHHAIAVPIGTCLRVCIALDFLFPCLLPHTLSGDVHDPPCESSRQPYRNVFNVRLIHPGVAS